MSDQEIAPSATGKRGRPTKGTEPKPKKTMTQGSRTSSRVANEATGTKLSSEISFDNLKKMNGRSFMMSN